MAQRTPTQTPPADSPAAEAKQALAQWRLALRYAAAAAGPVAKSAARAVGERASRITAHKESLAEHLDPTRAEQGDRMGDAVDALLGKLGTPGRLAAQASLGSRALARLQGEGGGSDGDDDRGTEPGEEPEDAPDSEAGERSPDATAEGEEPEGSAEPAEGHVAGTAADRRDDEGADPLRAGFKHAYSEEVENYDHQDAYTQTR